VDGLFVGTDDGAAVDLPEFGKPRRVPASGATWFRDCAIVVHSFDSTYWRVFVRADAAAEALLARFSRAVRLA